MPALLVLALLAHTATPTEVVVTPDYSLAAAFNADSNSVSIIDIATDAVEELPVREDFNDILISLGNAVRDGADDVAATDRSAARAWGG